MGEAVGGAAVVVRAGSVGLSCGEGLGERVVACEGVVEGLADEVVAFGDVGVVGAADVCFDAVAVALFDGDVVGYFAADLDGCVVFEGEGCPAAVVAAFGEGDVVFVEEWSDDAWWVVCRVAHVCDVGV